ncbi:MAG: glucose/quinate/shikimate family membrane-bound PQQ-dependent dehydrogenase [Parvularculaceae bacterium]
MRVARLVLRKPYCFAASSALAAFLSAQSAGSAWAADGAQWLHYGGSLAGERYAAQVDLSPDTVGALERAWVFRTGDATDGTGFGGGPSSFKATPILFEGRLYFSSGFNRVYAIDAASGELIWRFDPEVDFSRSYSEMFTSRGVALWAGAGVSECAARIFAGTLDARLIALDARTGAPCVTFGDDGVVDLSASIRNYRKQDYSLTSPPTVVGDLVIVGSAVGDNGAVELESGVVRAYDARTGREIWRWDPIPRGPDEDGWESWADGAGARTGGANVWSIMSADPDRDLIFLPTTSPSPDFYGGMRLGDNAHANSVVALRASTGERVWSFQTVRHDLWDYDIASQPLLARATRDGRRHDVILQATKMGFVFTLDRETGAPFHAVEMRDVPASDVPGERAAKQQVFPLAPEALHPISADFKIFDYSESHRKHCEAMLEGVRYEGIFTPPSLQGTMLYPGNPGGTNWGSMAADPERGLAFAVVNRLPTVVALVARDAYEARRQAEAGGPFDIQFTAQRGAPYGMMRYNAYNRELLLPCLEGPWGELVAIDISQGRAVWRTPIGVHPIVADHPMAKNWGFLGAGGPAVTRGGLVFLADRFGVLRAYDAATGDTVWSDQLPAGAHATPMAFALDGDEYIAIAAGGAVDGSDLPGDYLVAYRRRR